jgi:hypothetical protein
VSYRSSLIAPRHHSRVSLCAYDLLACLVALSSKLRIGIQTKKAAGW